MRTFIKLMCCGLLAAMPLQTALSQPAGGADVEGQRMKGGGINYAPRPAIYSVISIDSYARTVRLRASDGRTADVHVAEDIYDISKLKAGDKIRVDFVAAGATNSKLSAASVWPVK